MQLFLTLSYSSSCYAAQALLVRRNGQSSENAFRCVLALDSWRKNNNKAKIEWKRRKKLILWLMRKKLSRKAGNSRDKTSRDAVFLTSLRLLLLFLILYWPLLKIQFQKDSKSKMWRSKWYLFGGGDTKHASFQCGALRRCWFVAFVFATTQSWAFPRRTATETRLQNITSNQKRGRRI